MEFSDLYLNPKILQALTNEGYTNPTPIQEKAIPQLLDGKDLMGIAQTGTGKTAAFMLPILQHLFDDRIPLLAKAPRTLILAPTRELAAQIGESCKVYGKYLKIKSAVIFGGVNQNPQVIALKKGVDVLVATPGRLLDLVEQRHIRLDHVEIFVLDEADRMLDMGFIHDVKKTIAKLPKVRQTLCFSATMSGNVETLARSLLRSPVHVEVTPQATTVERINQKVLFVDQENKDSVLFTLLKGAHLQKVLIFTRTKHRANKIAKKLATGNIIAGAIHGNKSQNQRTQTLAGFQSGKIRVLVATDIAARGIDVEGISHVINYDIPNEPEVYVHRIGRTARAGADGTAYSLCAAEERGYLADIEELTNQKIKIISDHKYHSQKAQDSKGPLSRSAHKQVSGQRPNSRKSFGQRKAKRNKPKYKKKFASRRGPPKKPSFRK